MNHICLICLGDEINIICLIGWFSTNCGVMSSPLYDCKECTTPKASDCVYISYCNTRFGCSDLMNGFPEQWGWIHFEITMPFYFLSLCCLLLKYKHTIQTCCDHSAQTTFLDPFCFQHCYILKSRGLESELCDKKENLNREFVIYTITLPQMFSLIFKVDPKKSFTFCSWWRYRAGSAWYLLSTSAIL